MRFASLLVVVVVLGAALAGCTKKGGDDHDHTYTCANGTELDLEDFPDHDDATFDAEAHCTSTGTGTGTRTTTTAAPRVNIKPTLVINITNSTGVPAIVTLLDGSLTFSVVGSTDADGAITGAAVSVQDSNTTRTRSLYNPTTKALIPATLIFDTAGVVNVTFVIIDDFAGVNSTTTKVYVNTITQATWDPMGYLVGDSLTTTTWPDNCLSPTHVEGSSQEVTDSAASATTSISVKSNASYVVVREVTGNVRMVICTPAAPGPTTAISPAADARAVTDAGVVFVKSEGYYVRLVALAPPPTPPLTDLITVSIEVHYEPRPAAP